MQLVTFRTGISIVRQSRQEHSERSFDLSIPKIPFSIDREPSAAPPPGVSTFARVRRLDAPPASVETKSERAQQG